MALNLEYIGYDTDDTNETTTISRSYSIAISDLSSSDVIVICTCNHSSTGDWNRITGCTVNSETATEAARYGSATSYVDNTSRYCSAIYYVTGITGASLSIEVAGVGSDVYRSSCIAYRITGEAFADISISDSDAVAVEETSSPYTITNTVDIPAGAIVVTMGNTDKGSSSYTIDFDWGSTATEDCAGVADSYLDFVGAHVSASSSARSSYDIDPTVTVTSGVMDIVLVSAVFAPPHGWTGKIWGVENPASIWGIDVANIAKVHGL